MNFIVGRLLRVIQSNSDNYELNTASGTFGTTASSKNGKDSMKKSVD